jgi:hypothetical protein
VSSKANGDYNKGAEVKISAFPDWGFEFLRWEGDITGDENPLLVKMDSAINLTAVFNGPDGIFENNKGNSNKFDLKCFPNPMSALISISYKLENNTNVKLTIINSTGQKVAVLENNDRTAGEYTVKWNATSGLGDAVPNGMYIIRLQANGLVSHKQLILIR